MKKLSLRSVLAIGLVMVAGTVVATTLGKRSASPLREPENRAWQQRQQVERKVGAHIKDKQGLGLYYVHFADAPLAGYDGSQKGLAATSIRASKGRNRGRDGVLDLKSSSSTQYLGWLNQRQQQTLTLASQKVGRKLTIQRRYSVVLNAAVVALSDSESAALATVAGIRRVEPVRYHHIHTDAGPRFIGAPAVWSGTTGVAAPSQGEGVVIGIMDTGIRPDHPAFADVGADGFDHQNPRGSGNYLGDCLIDASLCNDKLIGIVSYEDLTSFNLYNPDKHGNFRAANGVDYNGHGTHVAATAAGNVVTNVPIFNAIGDRADANFPQVSGVAPHANIVAYQVCGWHGVCMPHLAVAAIEHAIANGVRVLNYSVGGPAGDPWQGYGEAEAFLLAREAGIHIATSAGNSGPNEGTVSTPGNLPWVTSVAAYTHDRGVTGKTLQAVAGGASPLPLMTGAGLSGSVQGRLVDAQDFGDGRCLTPFAAGTFDGAIVLCRRGDIARVEKGRNVKAGGAIGMVLINVDAGADNIEHDPQPLPSIQLKLADGNRLLEWLAAGVNHEVGISAGTLAADAARGDMAGFFSSRGPVQPSANYLVPSVAAPGVAVYAAWIEDAAYDANAFEGPYAFLDGTSMASPHVAGALALMVATRPSWTPAEAQSALMSTAWTTTRNHLGQASTHFDHGAGRIRVADAIKAGLVLDETVANYRAANPNPWDGSAAGEPADLNLASLTWRECILDCVWTRRFKATVSGSWTVAASDLSAGLSVSAVPNQFSLNAGETVTLTITASAGSSLSPGWAQGKLVITPANAAVSATVLPITASFKAGQMPAEVNVAVQRNAGSLDIAGIRSVATDALQISAVGFVRANRHTGFVVGDESPWSIFDNYDNWHFVPVSLDSDTAVLHAAIHNAVAPDLDLYLVRDMNLNNRIDPEEFYFTAGPTCTSAGPTAEERCVVNNPSPGAYVLGVHSYQGTASGAVDRHVLEVAVLRSDDQSNLTVSPPDTVPDRTPWSLPVGWNLPDMAVGDNWYGFLKLGTTAAQPGNIGQTLIKLTRTDDDVRLSAADTDIAVGEVLIYRLQFADNPDSTARQYQVELPLPEPLNLIAADGNPERDGDTLRWTVLIPPGGAGPQLTVQLTTEAVEGFGEFAPVLQHRLNDGPVLPLTAPTVLVRGTPVARINNAATLTLDVPERQSITVSTTGSRGASPDDPLEYQWQQVAGPAVNLQPVEPGQFKLTVPPVASDTILRFQLRVSNGEQTSAPAELTVRVKNQDPAGNGGGGAVALALWLLPALLYCRRRRQ